MHMFSACSIFIINASLWKTLQATLLFNPLVPGVSYMLHVVFFGAVTRILA